jgi:hypothetical protein
MRIDIMGLAQPLLAQDHEQSTLPLPQCGGQIKIDRNEWQTVLRFEHVRYCPYLEIKSSRRSLELAADGTYSHMYVWHKPWVAQKLDLVLHAAGSEKSDRYTLHSQPVTSLEAQAAPNLYMIEMSTHAKGLAVKLQNTSLCSRLELVRFNQLPMNQKFDLERQSEPQEIIIGLPQAQSGSNRVELRWGGALIHYYFRDGRWFFTGQ